MNEIKEIAKALANAQSQMSGAKKNKKNPFFKSTYSDLSSVFEALREPFAENGLSITQPLDVLENGRTVIITRIIHESGEFIESKMLLPDLADIQKLGGAITYCRRYLLTALAGLASEDDDGNAASAAQAKEANRITPEMINKMIDVVSSIDGLEDELKKLCNTKDLKTISKSQYEACQKYSQSYIQKKNNVEKDKNSSKLDSETSEI